MRATRLFLWTTGLLFVAFGLAYLIAPVPMAALAALDLTTPLSIIEVRGFYGGQLVGIGAFVLLGAIKPRFVVPALLLIAASLAGTAFGRVVGIGAAGRLPPMILGALVIEVGGAALAWFLYTREPRGGAGLLVEGDGAAATAPRSSAAGARR